MREVNLELLLIFVLCTIGTTFGVAPCSSFSTKCSTEIGRVLANSRSHDEIFNLTESGSLFFSFTQPADFPSVKILASVFYGNIEMFVSFGQEFSPTKYSLRTDRGFQDILEVGSNVGKTSREINVMLKASTPCAIRVIPTTSSTSTGLKLGFPQIDKVLSGGQNTYTFVPLTSSPINIVITPFIDGDPNIHITGPGNPPREWTSEDVGSDSVLITPSATEIGNTFTVRVPSANVSFFTIIVSESTTTSPTVLLGGFPLEAEIAANMELFYTLQVPPGLADVVLLLSPVYGDADIFVNTQIKGFYHYDATEATPSSTWSSQLSYGTDSIVIGNTDPSFLSHGGQYFITVHADRASKFVLRGYSAETVITLTEGSPIIDTVSAKSYHYYRFVNGDPSRDLIFDVSPLTGDPDLLVGCHIDSTGDDSGYPSRLYHHFNYSSLRGGEDTLLVRSSDASACPSNIYYLAVYAFSNSRFSLTATHQGGTVTLQDGVPVQSSSFAYLGKFFQFVMGPEAMELTISLTPGSGDLDLFVSTSGPVSRYKYDYSSTASGTSQDQVVISETAGCVDCVVSILVYGITTSRFSLVASLEDTTIQLANAKPLKEAVAWAYIQYYTLQASENGTANVVLTVLSGAPELYLSTVVEKPSRITPNTVVNNMASIGNLPVAFIDVREGDTLYIGVGGAGTNATYTVRAHVRVAGREPLLSMLEAIPQGDAIGMNGPAWNYYQINMPAGHESISLRATALVGNIDLYVMKCPFQSSECAGTHTENSQSYLPDETHFDVTTAGAPTDYLTVSRNDDVSVSYIIGVDSDSMYAEYHISMSMENSILALSPGTPVTDFAKEGEYDYFSVFAEDAPQVLTIQVTPLSGDLDLFVSTSVTRPNMTHSMWQSRKFGEDSIAIDSELDAKACTGCTYYIAVYGYREGTYSLMAGTESTVGRLLDGVPVQSSVAFFTYKRYTFKNTYGIGKNFKIMLTVLSGSPVLYVTLDGSVPSFTRYDYMTASWTTGSTSLTILSSDSRYAPCLQGNCDIRIGVYGALSTTYSLSITSSAASTVLRMDIPIQASVGQAQYDYFKIALSDPRDGVRLSLTEFSGSAVLYVSCHTHFPNSTTRTHEWLYMGSDRSVGPYLEITGLDLSDRSCPMQSSFLYMSVRGWTSATYSLVASLPGNATTPRLIPGLPVREYVPYTEFDYFYFRPSSSSQNDNVRVIVSAAQGDVDIYVSASWSTRPRYSERTEEVYSYILRSDAIGNDNLLISRNDMHQMCKNRGEDCYIIIGVFGAYDGHGVGSSYRIELSLQESTITLSSGVSVQSRLDDHSSDFFKYTITAPDKDVVISVTALSGDPDVFVGVDPNRHPSYSNYSWMTAYWGADTLTIQHEELSKHCIPVPAAGKNCDIYIAIFAWKNCSYTIVATMDEGSSHPVALVDGQPQSGFVALGSYTYYSFFISSHDGQALAASLIVTLTSVDGDQDIFVTMNDNTEPGKNNYDYMSANFGGVTDEVEVGVGMPHYCMNCFVNIAVYGFKEGHYSITATSKGVQQLQSGVAMGGHLEQGKYRYYTIRNSNPTAQITVTLTPISGDPDLYMNVYGQADNDKPYEFPRNYHYTWRSIHAGNDQISVNYADAHFCVDCTYVVGIYSFRNSSYTILMTDTENAIVTLTRNRPQIVHVIDPIQIQYFRATSLTSSEDLTITLSNMASTAHIPMYISRHSLASYNGSLPNPADPTTYSYSNVRTNADSIFIHESFTEPQMYVIAAKPTQATMMSVLFSSATRPIVLQSGVPQTHYVTQGSMGLFTYYINQYEDVQVSISAISGDPDLFISSTQVPVCDATASYYSVKCSNYTWSSTSYSTDQIIISKDLPCNVIMPGTHVAAGCTETAFHLGALNIGVYGFSTSRFMIMATPRGGHVTLFSGKPQLSYTSLGYICSDRDKQNGACLASSWQYVQESVAYFTFAYSADSKTPSDNTIMFTVIPKCNASRAISGSSCQPGCDCNPVGVYIMSCPVSKCEASHKFPSYLRSRNQASMTVTASSPTLALTPLDAAYCSPAVHGEPCMYYASVISKQKTEMVAFTLSVDTPGDIGLISCDTAPSPDGFRTSRISKLNSHVGFKYFELCSKTGGSGGSSQEELVVSVEQCSGETSLYACSEDTDYCDSFLPTDKSWQFFADSSKSCQRKKAHSSSASCIDSSGLPVMRLPERNGNYNVKVNGTGEFYFTVQNTHSGNLLAPALKFDGIDQSEVNKFEAIHVGSTSLTVSWKNLRVLMPGASMPAPTPNIRYKLYLFDLNKLKEYSSSPSLVLNTPCGLDFAASAMSDAARVITVSGSGSDSAEMEHVINDLQRSSTYFVALVGECDANCLRQVSKVSTSLLMSCAGNIDCKAQSYVYQALTEVHTSNKDGKANDESGSNSLNGFILLSLVVVVATVMSLFGVYSYYVKSKREIDGLSDFEMTDFSSGPAGNVGDVFSFGNSPPATSKGPSQSLGQGGKSVLSRFGGLETSLFSSYSPLIKDDQHELEDEEITVNL